MEKVYVTRRNLLALLSKLDRNKQTPGVSHCTIVKQDTEHPVYPASTAVMFTAVEDDAYYTDRPAGNMYSADTATYDACRTAFEAYIQKEVSWANPNLRVNSSWSPFERSKSGGGRTGLPETINDGYLDLYIFHRWESWKACWHLVHDND